MRWFNTASLKLYDEKPWITQRGALLMDQVEHDGMGRYKPIWCLWANVSGWSAVLHWKRGPVQTKHA